MMPMAKTLGPVMVGISGYELQCEDRERLLHPATGGVLLFSYNYADPEQLRALTTAIHALRDPPLLIAVDHEGGRVQRFREGFTALPPMGLIGEIFTFDPLRGQSLAQDAGLVMATELRAHGVDISFAPVLDLALEVSAVIGDRAFHQRPDVVAMLAGALLDGMEAGGLAGVGKHYPGHGAVAADSHLELPIDSRLLAQIEGEDLAAFIPLLPRLGGIMPAHVLFPEVDSRPAGFSGVWLHDLLRGRYGFTGAIFSDDLGMAGAEAFGAPGERAHGALYAGCDMILISQDMEAAGQILTALEDRDSFPESVGRLERLRLPLQSVAVETLSAARHRLECAASQRKCDGDQYAINPVVE
jgi:beta-N-acetylhexosaminidase